MLENFLIPLNPPTKSGKLGEAIQKFVFVGKYFFANVTFWAWASRGLTCGNFF